MEVFISGDYTVNQYFINSDSTWWARHNQVVPLGHPGHEWVKAIFILGVSVLLEVSGSFVPFAYGQFLRYAFKSALIIVLCNKKYFAIRVE